MKSTIGTVLFVASLFSLQPVLLAQPQSVNYFGQEPPLYFPKVFGDTLFPKSVYTISYSPDGTEMVYSGNYDAYTIKYRKYADGAWSEETEPPFCIAGDAVQDASPCFSPDGSRIYFCSNREGGYGDYDIWYVEKNDTGWGTPVNAGDKVNSAGREDYPFIAEDGTLYFDSGREGANGFTDIFYSAYRDGEFQDAVPLPDSVNTAGSDDNPAILGSKLFIGQPAQKEFMISNALGNNSWSKPEPVTGGLFPKGYSLGFRLTPDKKYFMYTMDPSGSGSNFTTYWVDAEVLEYLGVKEAPFNYVAGWYTANEEQMALALHPELAKRQAVSADRINYVSYSWMLDATKACYGCIDSVKKGRKELTILHQTETTATVKAMSEEYYDFLHLVKFDGHWKVLNALWDYHSKNTQGDSARLVQVLDSYVANQTTDTKEQFAALFHKEFKGRYALSHSDVHSVNKEQFLSLQEQCSSCGMQEFTYKILDRHKDIASILVSKGDSVEYLHLTYQAGQWYIINAVRNFRYDPERVYNRDTPIRLSGKSITEGDPIGTVLGELALKLPKGPKAVFYLHECGSKPNNNDWFTLENNVVKNSHIFTASDTGSYAISVIAVINAKDTICASFPITVHITTATTIGEQKGFLLYPNPNNGTFTICLQGIENVTGIAVADILGNTVAEQWGPLPDEEVFNLPHLAQGRYSVTVRCADRTIQETIIVRPSSH